MNEVVRELLVESYESLDQFERDIVSFESRPGPKELLSSISRTIHTIRGTSDFLAFNRLKKLVHRGENLLSELHDGIREMDQETADVLLSMVDRIRAIMGFVKETDQEGNIGIDSVITQIEAIQSKTESVAKLAAEQAPHEAERTPAEVPSMTNVPDEKGETSMGEPTEVPFMTDVPDEKGQTSIGAEAPTAQAETKPESAPAKPAQSAGMAVAAANSRKDTKSADHPTNDHERSAAESPIRIDVDLLDVLVRKVSGLVLMRNQTVRQADNISDMNLVQSFRRLSIVATEL